MLKTESNCINLATAVCTLSVLLAVLGMWAASGSLAFLLLAAALVLNAGAVACFPFIAEAYDKDAFYTGMVFMGVTSLTFGGIVFHWWGIAYGVFAFVVYLFGATLRNEENGTF